ncbi:hypothetical protein HMPREF0372_01183 [Flavonifractor plautii ATCC 29863]|uniref:Uncharacterized protein n=1 Tax=Flavonifractor plautii ATCC 29863 TaxID=411475 RepID=G9YNV5_FLAPL|nr:hypothetical protein HMPREF0372_01183 [Flavonifractor plautii ATCC 29863]
MNSYRAGSRNAIYACQNNLTNLHLLFSDYKKEKMHRQLQKGILKAILNPYIMAVQHFLFPTMM